MLLKLPTLSTPTLLPNLRKRSTETYWAKNGKKYYKIVNAYLH